MPSRFNGFVRLRPCAEAWTRCRNYALPKSRLYAKHSAALASVLLGLPELERKLYALQKQFEAAGFRRRREELRLAEIRAGRTLLRRQARLDRKRSTSTGAGECPSSGSGRSEGLAKDNATTIAGLA